VVLLAWFKGYPVKVDGHTQHVSVLTTCFHSNSKRTKNDLVCKRLKGADNVVNRGGLSEYGKEGVNQIRCCGVKQYH